MGTPPGEFELIARLAARLRPAAGQGVVGIGDDAAAIPSGDGLLVLTCDIAVEGRHFLRDRTPLADVGWRTATANVSDVLACGGRPTCALISLGVPADADAELYEELYRGLALAADHYDFQVLGGNVSGAAEMILDVFMVGETPRFVSRRGARPGDLVAVSGTLGDSEAGRRLLGTRPTDAGGRALLRRHLHPEAPMALREPLLAAATAAIDVSDGLAPDAHHLATLSGVHLALEASRVPCSEALRAFAATRGEEPLHYALHGGEEYQLLFTLAEGDLGRFPAGSVTVIGEVRAGEGVTLSGRPLAPEGWDHLRPLSP